MALVKYNNNSIANITTAGQLAQGKMTLISSQTASGSASIEFTSGIDSTYPIYRFEFINIHPATDGVTFQVNFRDGGSLFDATKTTTSFFTYHNENDTVTSLSYDTGEDLAQSTGKQTISTSLGNDADQDLCGTLQLFSPSSTTFVKHFITDTNMYSNSNFSVRYFIAGYCNTTNAIDGVQFAMSSGNIDSGTIKLYGIKGD
jgi:hypothetical protein